MTNAERIAQLEKELADAKAALESKATTNEVEVNTVSNSGNPKLPVFWQRDPQLWFAQVEAQFHSLRIRTDITKYFTVVAALDSSVLQHVADVIANPPESNKYDAIKQKLIRAYTDSQERQIRKLLNELELGDRKPSQLLREMKTLAGTQMQDDFLKTLWLQRLPANVQLVLSGTTGLTFEKTAELADKMVEIHISNAPHAAIATVTKTAANTRTTNATGDENTTQCTTPMEAMQKQIATLTATVERLVTDRGRGYNTNKYGRYGRHRSNSRSRTHVNENKGLCYYHETFGEKARKCHQPCNYSGN
ncbi:hypothetical protein Zmor_006637 [Zophobas morio]|uniref:DUF7041 domain-containing protein n=1 Tax=Zophobas morio TaxID=2755281 RepID=A0AA38ISN3_9CUCU|nr:hypothetical protein Zmor_006637 [Zophobas morio]